MKLGFRPIVLLSLSVFLALSLSLSVASELRAAAPGPSPKPRAGDRAPSFALKSVDSGELTSLDGMVTAPGTKGLVVVFLSCRCPYVAQARQPLGALSKRYAGQIAFVGINANQNEPADDIKADAAARFSFPVLRDEAARVADLYAADRTPEAFLIDGKGIIRYHGGVADLEAALTDLVAGRPVARPEGKAFGCTIKRKT